MSGGTVAITVTARIAVTTIMPAKIHRQLANPVTTPPITNPLAPPAAPAALHTARARFRRPGSALILVRMLNAAGTVRAAPAPWSARPAVKVTIDVARPATAAPPAKITKLIKTARRCPTRSATRAANINSPPNSIAYPVAIRLLADDGALTSVSI